MSLKDKKPEKIVEEQVMAWCRSHNIFVQVFDSKATWSPSAGRFLKTQGMQVGVPDLLGLNFQGIFVAIELKAPGKESVCRLEQWKFLERVIQHNGFGVVVSSVQQIDALYSEFLRSRDPIFLLSKLPKKVLVKIKGKQKTITV